MNWLVAVLGPLAAVLKIAKWRNALPLIAILITLVFCAVIWDSRVPLGDKLVKALDDRTIRKVMKPATLEKLSEATRKRVDSFTLQDNFVDMTVVFAVDQGNETRTVLYRSISDTVVADKVAKQDALTTRDLVLPFRTREEAWNVQMYALLDGEFKCWKPDTSGIFYSYPTLQGILKTVCRIPIPPSWSNQMAGYIAFYSTKELTDADMLKLRIKARYLSLDIHSIDVKQEPVQFDRH